MAAPPLAGPDSVKPSYCRALIFLRDFGFARTPTRDRECRQSHGTGVTDRELPVGPLPAPHVHDKHRASGSALREARDGDSAEIMHGHAADLAARIARA